MMFRSFVVSSIAMACFSTTAMAQSLTPTDAAEQLEAIATRLIQHQRDVSAVSRGQVNCDILRANDDVYVEATLATEEVQAAQGMLAIYAFIPTTADRTQARTYLVRQMLAYRRLLEVNIESLNSALGISFLPAGVAVLGTRVRDDMRAAIVVLERTAPQ